MKRRTVPKTLMLSALSLVSIGTYVGLFAFSSKATEKQMLPPNGEGKQAYAKLEQLTATYQQLLQREANDEDDLKQANDKYSQAYNVAQHDDQVLAAISQQLQSQGLNPLNVQNTPAPPAGVTVNTSPPIIQSTTRAS